VGGLWVCVRGELVSAMWPVGTPHMSQSPAGGYEEEMARLGSQIRKCQRRVGSERSRLVGRAEEGVWWGMRAFVVCWCLIFVRS